MTWRLRLFGREWFKPSEPIPDQFEGLVVWEFTPQNDITALELALILKKAAPPARHLGLIDKMVLYPGQMIDERYARHFSMIGPYKPGM